jgi:hypothetical protein
MTPTSRPARSPHASLARTARAVRRAALALVLALPLACRGDGGGPAGPDPSIAGEWSGSAYVGLVDFRATFTESGGVVGGTGHFSSPRGSDDFVVSGTVSGSDVSLVLTSDTFGATTFIGRFTAADRIRGTLDLPDDDIELTIERD